MPIIARVFNLRALVGRLYPARLCLVVVLTSILFTAMNQSYAAVDAFEFDTQLQQQRFRKLSNEFRCPQCQNSNLTGSTGGIAEDLRREVHRLIMEGKSDQEITRFMYDRYGDFVLYRPQLRLDTLVLWFGPLLFLLFGGYIISGIVRRARTSGAVASLSDIEQEKLNKLFKQ